MMKTFLFDSSLWKILCSLKLTIVLASAATLIVIGGSLVMPSNPRIFSGMDSMPLGTWLSEVAAQAPTLTWWVPVAGVLIALLGINTLCCFVDWLAHFRARWRKFGEYLIHLGFVLILVAYLWGSLAGFRRERNPVFVGQTVPLPLQDVSLKLEAFEPVFNASGRPVDMINSLVLYEGDRVVQRVRARTNHPLTWGGLAVLPSSYGQTGRAGQYRTYSILTVNYDPGAGLAFAGGVAMGCGVLFALVSFYRKRARGDRPDVA